jgi:hypothetical protein
VSPASTLNGAVQALSGACAVDTVLGTAHGHEARR